MNKEDFLLMHIVIVYLDYYELKNEFNFVVVVDSDQSI